MYIYSYQDHNYAVLKLRPKVACAIAQQPSRIWKKPSGWPLVTQEKFLLVINYYSKTPRNICAQTLQLP